MKPFRCFCLVRKGDPDRFVRLSVPKDGSVPQAIVHLGVTYRFTKARTNGGWRIYSGDA